MKKSNAMMLSYIILLSITVVVDIFTVWPDMDQIALASTVAGCFFAFADLSSWYASYTLPIAESIKEEYKVVCTYYETVINAFHKNKEEANGVIELLDAFVEKDVRIEEAVCSCRKVAESANKAEKRLLDSSSDFQDLEKSIEHEVSRGKLFEKLEIILAVLGFLSFFVLVTFDSLVSFLMPINSLITVAAFIIIMLNYFLRDILEDKAKQDVAEIRAHINERNDDIKHVEEIIQPIQLLDSAKKVAEKFKNSHITEACKNG